MMANDKIYVASWLLLVTLTSPLCQVSQAMPTPAPTQITHICVTNARALLWNITEALAMNNLFKGINCTEQEIELNTGTQTVTACAPKHSTCAGVTKSEFDKVSCMNNMVQDLHYYSSVLSSHPDPDHLLGTTVLQSLRELREKCNPLSPSEESTEKEIPGESSFNERLRLCKVLKGFKVRSLTIARVLSYLHAEDHRI